MPLPLVSVIIPGFNNERRIVYALQSAIEQSYENLEIIFVNDASTDNTLKNAEGVLKNCSRPYKIINHEKNLGVSVARNDGLLSSNGEYICFCDGDDMMTKNYVVNLMNAILKHDCDISFGGIIDRFEDGRPDKPSLLKYNLSQPMNGEDVAYLKIFWGV